ncbi:hypothetical protein M422DRAFT_786396, partial [Sphaerobolus stellatus SS14]
MDCESEPAATVDGESAYATPRCCKVGMEKTRKRDNNPPPSMFLQTPLAPIEPGNHREALTSQERYPREENRSHQIEDDGVNHKPPKSDCVVYESDQALFTALRLASKQSSFTIAGSFNMSTDVEMNDKDGNKAVALPSSSSSHRVTFSPSFPVHTLSSKRQMCYPSNENPTASLSSVLVPLVLVPLIGLRGRVIGPR